MRRIVLLPLFAGLAGCAAGSGLTAFERERLARRERGLAMATQRVHDAATLGRIGELLARIDPAAQPRLYVIEHPAPQAELIGGEVLLVRSGLLQAVRSDDELAFVLAHELAHGALGHVEARRRPEWRALEAEIAADAWARTRLAARGFRPEAGAELLSRLEPGLPEAARPVVRDRLQAMARAPASGRARPL